MKILTTISFIIFFLLSTNLSAEIIEEVTLNCQSETYHDIKNNDKKKHNQIFVIKLSVHDIEVEGGNFLTGELISEEIQTCFGYGGYASELMFVSECLETEETKVLGKQRFEINRITGGFSKTILAEFTHSIIYGNCSKAEKIF